MTTSTRARSSRGDGFVTVASYSPAAPEAATPNRSFSIVLKGIQYHRFETGVGLRSVRQGTILAGKFAREIAAAVRR